MEAIDSLDTALENSRTEETLLIKQAIAKALDSRANAKLNQQDDRISPEQRSSAIDDIKKSLSIKREIGDKAGQAMSLGTLGRYYLFTKDDKFFAQHSQDAVNAFEEDLKISEEIGILSDSLKCPLIAGCTADPKIMKWPLSITKMRRIKPGHMSLSWICPCTIWTCFLCPSIGKE